MAGLPIVVALKSMELWDGPGQAHAQQDVNNFRTKLAEDLVLSQLNHQAHDVRDERLCVFFTVVRNKMLFHINI